MKPRAAWRRPVAGALAWLCMPALAVVSSTRLEPLITGDGTLSPGWQFVGLSTPEIAATRFEVATQGGRPVLRVTADHAYGNLVHALAAASAPLQIAWRWRVETLAPAADLRAKRGDDVALKVCAFFDLRLGDVPFVERQLLKLARLRSGLDLPAATLCYVWDNRLPVGTVVENAYSRRVRMLVLQSGPARGAGLMPERRMLAADFLRAFGDETRTPPALTGIAVGADTDNAGGTTVGYLADLVVSRVPARTAERRE